MRSMSIPLCFEDDFLGSSRRIAPMNLGCNADPLFQ